MHTSAAVLAFLLGACAAGVRAPSARVGRGPGERGPGGPAAFPRADSEAATHLLNRFAFGPRPGDVERVLRIGITGWLDEQLEPSRLPDRAEREVAASHPLAFLDPDELFRRHPPPALARRLETQRPGMSNPDSGAAARQRQMRGYRELAGQVQMSALARHLGSERQLHEVMVDFWTNHFNVFMGKSAVRWLTGDFVERAIRPHALGRFEDLLVATAQHPAMLVYLDNALSVAPLAPLAPPARGPGGRRARGINENYARELLELHTLGVDGGYTQRDVGETARILTGWSLSRPGGGSGAASGSFGFAFHGRSHDHGEKTVLGERFPAGQGMNEGLRLLRMLARHPSTARHLAHKLCQRFVADDPPDGCVDAAAHAFTATGGEIRSVVRAIAGSPEFWAPAFRRAKVKTPLEFLASAVRALGGTPDSTSRLALILAQLGQPIFLREVPTGYAETSEEWVNSGALLNRMNVAVALASGRLPGVLVNLDAAVPPGLGPEALLAAVDRAVLGGRGSPATLRVIGDEIADSPDPAAARALAVGLALGSPDFQRQ